MQFCQDHSNEICKFVYKEQVPILTILILEESIRHVNPAEYNSDVMALIAEVEDDGGCMLCFVDDKNAVKRALFRFNECLIAS